MCRQCESFLVEAKWCFSDHFCILEVHLLSKMWLCFFFSGWLLRIELSGKQYFHSDFSLFVIFIIRWQTTLHIKNPLKMPVKKWAKTLLWQKKAGRRLTDKDNAKTSSFLPVTKTTKQSIYIHVVVLFNVLYRILWFWKRISYFIIQNNWVVCYYCLQVLSLKS